MVVSEEMKFTVVLAPEPNGGFSVICPSLAWMRFSGRVTSRCARQNSRGHPALPRGSKGRRRTGRQLKLLISWRSEIRACLKERAQEGLPLTIETHVVEVEAGVAA